MVSPAKSLSIIPHSSAVWNVAREALFARHFLMAPSICAVLLGLRQKCAALPSNWAHPLGIRLIGSFGQLASSQKTNSVKIVSIM